MVRAVAVALIATGCWTATPATPPRPPHVVAPPIAGFVEADLLTVDNLAGTITTFAIDHDTIRELGTTKVGPTVTPPPDDPDVPPFAQDNTVVGTLAGYATRDDLFVRTGPHEVLHVTATAKARIALPAYRAKPTMFAPWSRVDLVVDDDGAWWSVCTEVGYEDGGRCAAFTSTRVWPSGGEVETGESGHHDRAFGWPTTRPIGYAIDGATCTTPDGVAHVIDEAKPDSFEGIYATAWVSIAPPRLLVIHGVFSQFHGASPAGWKLWDGCTRVLADGWGSPTSGPGDLWEGGGTIYRGATALGSVGGGAVHFRPRP